MSRDSALSFDYIVVGGGSAGCLLANRLSADPRCRVALVEAGGRDNWVWFHIPVGYLFAIGNPRADWMYRTAANAQLAGRVLDYPRGKVLGGSSAINAMIYMRGQAADYDGWRDMGLDGWGWEDVLPFFLRHEDSWRGAGPVHASGGEWRVERPRMRWDILDRFGEAAAEAGIPRSPDFNTGDNEGSGYFDVNQSNGRRWSSARGFLAPVARRPNLEIFDNTAADRVGFAGKRAERLIARRNGSLVELRARSEIILAAGAIGTPGILERSGVGDGRRLQALGIDAVHHLPGVGENLQDHLQLRLIYKVSNAATLNTIYRSWLRRAGMGMQYAFLRRGPMTMAPSQFGAFTRSDPRHDRPNIQFHIQPLSLDRFGETLHDFPAMTVSVCNLRPTSRGAVHIPSADPGTPPGIDPNYLSTAEDQRIAVESIRRAREVMAQPALFRHRPEEFRPGRQSVTDEQLLDATAQIATTIFHPVGTARMGAVGDEMAVVDPQLRVRGVERLRVIDASVMPAITSGNTNSPTLMIAEKGAAAVLAARKG